MKDNLFNVDNISIGKLRNENDDSIQLICITRIENKTTLSF